MRLVLCIGIFIAVLLVCTTVFAQGEPFKFRLSSWDTEFNMNLTVSQDSTIGTELSSNMLGLRNDHSVPSLELIFYQSGFKLTLGYWEALYTGTGQLTTNITFAGVTYSVSDVVDSKLKITSYDLRAQLNLFSISNTEIGVVGGVRFLNYYVQIVDTTSAFAESDEAFAPVPYIGGAAEFPIENLFVVGANVVTFSYSDKSTGLKLNSYLDTNFYAELRIGPIAARAGYSNIKLNFEKTGTDAVDMDHYIKGPFFGVYIALPL
jgi:hypothetical protein